MDPSLSTLTKLFCVRIDLIHYLIIFYISLIDMSTTTRRRRRSLTFAPKVAVSNGRMFNLATNSRRYGNSRGNVSKSQRYNSTGPYENVPKSNLWWSEHEIIKAASPPKMNALMNYLESQSKIKAHRSKTLKNYEQSKSFCKRMANGIRTCFTRRKSHSKNKNV